MKIRKISAYQADLPLAEGPYNWSGRNTVTVFDSTIVRIDTDEGLSGFGEVCPLGPAYLPAYAAGARTGIAAIGPALLGLDPRALGPLNDVMDAALKGHPYAKSPLDVACWDIFGQAAGLPLCEMLGGRHGDDFVLYRAISQESPERMAELVSMHREAGYTRFQLKVGSDTAADIRRIEQAAGLLGDGERLVADANTGWLPHDALRVVRAVRD
ncbi:MAG: mandelate racemase/muconate lactonizing enzyme family protein, partial [Bryobacterales bacterium]|nr:mandelate racemase/muconate lactonizing enzyme family protein [Bryobacterales bacterium]